MTVAIFIVQATGLTCGVAERPIAVADLAEDVPVDAGHHSAILEAPVRPQVGVRKRFRRRQQRGGQIS